MGLTAYNRHRREQSEKLKTSKKTVSHETKNDDLEMDYVDIENVEKSYDKKREKKNG